jgi:hypothetical protein
MPQKTTVHGLLIMPIAGRARLLPWWRMLLVIVRVIVIGLLAIAAPAHAESDAPAPSDNRFKLRGFGTLGLALSSVEGIQFVRDLSQPYGLTGGWTGKIDSLLGVQANIGLAEHTEVVLQAVSRYHSTDNFAPELNWAFLRHDFSPDFSMRFGRLGTEFYMLADSRLVGYSNLMVRPQSDFYGTLVFSHLDGADATYDMPLGNGVLRGKFSLGLSPEKAPVVGDIQWDLEGTLISGGYLDYQSGPWQLRASHIGMRFKHEMPFDAIHTTFGLPPLPASYVALVPQMSMVNQWAWYSSLGLVYDNGPLLLQFMLQQINHESAAYEDSKAGFALAAYRMGDITPYVGISRVISRPDRLAPSAIPGLGGLLDVITANNQAQTHNDQTTLSLGVRWDFLKDMALKAQLDRLQGNPASVYLFRGAAPKLWDGAMTVFSIALDVVF